MSVSYLLRHTEGSEAVPLARTINWVDRKHSIYPDFQFDEASKV